MAIGATAVAVSQQRRAERQRHDAELDALDGSVIGTADTDFALSALLATEAHRLRPDGNSLVALNRSLRALPNITRAIYPSYVSSQTMRARHVTGRNFRRAPRRRPSHIRRYGDARRSWHR